MPSLTILLTLAVPAGSQNGVPSVDYATSIRLPSAASHAPLSQEWALAYNQVPKLIEMPAPVEAASPTPGQDDLLQNLSQYVPSPAVDPSRLHDRTMSDLSLDWGLANIGPGVLTPQPGLMNGGRSAPGFPGGGTGSSGQPAGTSSPIFITLPGNTPGGTTTPTTPPTIGPPPPVQQGVPEPASLAVWLLILMAIVVAGNRRPNPPAVTVVPGA
jgi:hypothetical protein